MARYLGPRFKVARHLGVNVFNHPKALKRGVKPHNKLSEYGEQLLEKQKLRMYYGVMEKQFKRYIGEALNSPGVSGEVLVQNLERRLDNIVYRLGFSTTLRQARQMVVHGHIQVNGKKVDIPSYRVSVGDMVALRVKSKLKNISSENFISQIVNLGYLEKDIDTVTGKIVRLPRREEIPVDVKDSKVIEYYAKN